MSDMEEDDFNFDLTYTNTDIGSLDTWVIDDEQATPSDYKVIVYNLADPKEEGHSMGTSQEITEWEIRAMSGDSGKEALKA